VIEPKIEAWSESWKPGGGHRGLWWERVMGGYQIRTISFLKSS
jgi:hypothetical protein